MRYLLTIPSWSTLEIMVKNYELKGGTWKVKGLGNHDSTSSHPFSMRMLDPKHQHSPQMDDRAPTEHDARIG